MIKLITVTALVGKNEKEIIFNTINKANWKQITSNCLSAEISNDFGVQAISLTTTDEKTNNTKKYQYNLLAVKFAFNDYMDNYYRYILHAIRELFPHMRKLNFKIRYIRYGIEIENPYAKQYYELLQHGFEMKGRNAVRTVNENHVEWKNEDTTIFMYYQNKQLFIGISLDKGKIHSLIRKTGLKSRTIKEILASENVKTIERYIVYDYLKAISGIGHFYSLPVANEKIINSQYANAKKKRLIHFLAEISMHGDIEIVLYLAEQGNITVTKDRKRAMDYIRDLNAININPLTINNSNVTMLPNILTLIK